MSINHMAWHEVGLQRLIDAGQGRQVDIWFVLQELLHEMPSEF